MTMAEELGPGDYQWFVSAVDVFGNLARSPAAGFRIAPSSG
jgi:hypothetical protein